MKHTQYWPVATAKAKFSELLEQAKSQGPQTVTRHGRPAVVVVWVRDWEAKAKRSKSLTEFLMNSPLRGSGLEPRRLRGKWRKTDL
ncbi:MAG: type II toxin-antitoxin system Phd/YefM family antitoxin [Phycisphaerae bacterium]